MQPARQAGSRLSLVVRFHLRLVAVLIVSCALSACVHLPRYPSAWALQQTLPGDECPLLSDGFRHDGIDSGSRVVTLSQVFTSPSTPIPPEDVAIVRFRLDQRTLWVVYEDEVGRLLRTSALTRVGVCSRGELVLEGIDTGGVNREGVIGVTRARLSLSRASDSSLVIRESGAGAVIALLVPVAVVAREWYKFEAEASAEPNKSLERSRER